MRDYDLLPRQAKDVIRSTIGRHVVAEFWWRWKFRAERTAAQQAEKAEIVRLRQLIPRLHAAKVVVVTPTYRRPDFLGKAVCSVLNQTEKDWAMLIVDDGGGQLVDLPADSRVMALSLSRNYGSPGLARNVALALSQSPFVAFLDDDNTWLPHHLELSLRELAAGKGLVYTQLRRTRPDGSELDILGKEFNRKAHRDNSWVDINAVTLRRTSDLRFDPWARPRWVHPREDWEFVHRLSKDLSVSHVPVTTVDYRVHEGSYFTDWDESAISVMSQAKSARNSA